MSPNFINILHTWLKVVKCRVINSGRKNVLQTKCISRVFLIQWSWYALMWIEDSFHENVIVLCNLWSIHIKPQAFEYYHKYGATYIHHKFFLRILNKQEITVGTNWVARDLSSPLMKGKRTVQSLVIQININFHVDTDDIYVGIESHNFFDLSNWRKIHNEEFHGP